MPSVTQPLPPDESRLRSINHVCTDAGLMLLQHGAESALVESVSRRLGLKLGAEAVEVAILTNALTLTTLGGGSSVTVVRRSVDRGLNMHVVMEVQRTLLMLEEGSLDEDGCRQRLESIRPLRHPLWLVAVMVGLSCAAFARLAGADLSSCSVAFAASAAAMGVRQLLSRLLFAPPVIFFASAFTATAIAGQALIHGFGAQPIVALASSVLLLVPGFPMINSVADTVKGYAGVGMARAMVATLLGASVSAGIVLALLLWRIAYTPAGPFLGPPPPLSDLPANLMLAAVPAVGFALLFNVPFEALGYCAALGALGRGLRLVLLDTGLPIEWATLAAAAVVSLCAVPVAHRLRAHPKVVTVAAVISMIPGVPFFNALLAFAEINRRGMTPELLSAAVTSGLRTVFIVSALAVGLALPGLLFYRRRPII